MADPKQKDGQDVPKTKNEQSEPDELDLDKLDSVAGGLMSSVPNVRGTVPLSSLDTPVCISQS